jgi:hypothetical protein
MSSSDQEYDRALDFSINNLDGVPLSALTLLKDMPAQAKVMFLNEYNSSRRSVLVAYLLHFLPAPFSFTYGYLGKWGKQIAYWFTVGGFGVWWLANVFRIPGLVKRHNNELSEKIIKSLLLSYTPEKKKSLNQPIKRQIDSKPDLSNLSVLDLDQGYLFDYEAKTWTVSSVRQFDWNDGTVEKQFKISCDLEKAFLVVSIEAEPSVFFTKPFNISRIDQPLEELILNGARPVQSFEYNGEKFFRESSDEGFAFQRNQAIAIRKWIYMDALQKNIIRIEAEGQDVSGFIGVQIRPSAILDILPSQK